MLWRKRKRGCRHRAGKARVHVTVQDVPASVANVSDDSDQSVLDAADHRAVLDVSPWMLYARKPMSNYVNHVAQNARPRRVSSAGMGAVATRL